MLMDNKRLTHLKVETQSGQEIGRVEGFEIETDSQSIINYIVSPAKLIKIKDDTLIINRGQVIDISEKKMVVEDNVFKQKRAKNKVQDRKAVGFAVS